VLPTLPFRPTFSAVFLSALLAGCAGNPATGGANVVFSSRGGEISVGEEMYQEILAGSGAYDDPELQAYVDRVGQRLAANSDMPDLKFTFTVVDSGDINAFATPGGYIYINRGLIAYLDNEAELAGVLGHEIGHVTARHYGRGKAHAVTSQAAAIAVWILTGSGDLADSSMIYGAELRSGYGREMELEADGLGARYMYASGYDPESLLEVLGVLKNHENYQNYKAKASGRQGGTYHGLYASHPRNDKRLKTVVNTASELDLDTYIEDPSVPGEFKRLTDGLVWGPSIQGERSETRFYHEKLEFTFDPPPGWTVEAGSSAIVASAPDGSTRLTLTLRHRDNAVPPRELLESSAVGTLSIGEELDLKGLLGYTAVASNGETAKRLAVVDFDRLTYLFEGEADDFAGRDAELKAIIESFRPMEAAEYNVGPGHHVRYRQVPRGATLESIAADMPIEDAEYQLRLINGYYPSGEPRTGDWIKVIE